MRHNLKNIGNNSRYTFIGTFVRFGKKTAFRGPNLPTVLLKDIHLENDDKILTDHLWFNKTKGFAEQDLHENDVVKFDGRVEIYRKGYQGYREDVFAYTEYDYKISRPTNIKNLTNPIEIIKPKQKRRTHEEVVKAKREAMLLLQKELEEKKREAEYKKQHPEEFVRMATEAQISYMNAISEATGISCDGLKTFDDVSLYLDCFSDCLLAIKRRKQSIETYKKVQKAIDAGLKRKEILKKLQISASTYQKYRNKNWVKNPRLIK